MMYFVPLFTIWPLPVITLFSSLVPFGTFVFDRSLKRELASG